MKKGVLPVSIALSLLVGGYLGYSLVSTPTESKSRNVTQSEHILNIDACMRKMTNRKYLYNKAANFLTGKELQDLGMELDLITELGYNYDDRVFLDNCSSRSDANLIYLRDMLFEQPFSS